MLIKYFNIIDDIKIWCPVQSGLKPAYIDSIYYIGDPSMTDLLKAGLAYLIFLRR